MRASVRRVPRDSLPNKPLQIDTVVGAYPSCVALPDGGVYCVYYEEGSGGSIRGVRLKVGRPGITLAAGQ